MQTKDLTKGDFQRAVERGAVHALLEAREGPGVHIRKAQVFAEIARLGKIGTTQATVEKATGLPKSALSRWVKELQADGLITKQRDQTNEKFNMLTVTEEGTALWAQARRATK